ncbi:hypothetical protein [Atlantibacter hermannii]|uniref:hypothetical protein n=1 Tax=Atlantibacter hermannii TaxID=565 RepID=UPI000EEF076B|nr:hypothetical protein [Atlantibacter hermannii]HAI50240.1 hypothetical protein [Enterobacteriaceae bacterium]
MFIIRIVSLIGRAFRAAFIPAHTPENKLTSGLFIPTCQGYGMDFSNSDPAWFRRPNYVVPVNIEVPQNMEVLKNIETPPE